MNILKQHCYFNQQRQEDLTGTRLVPASIPSLPILRNVWITASNQIAHINKFTTQESYRSVIQSKKDMNILELNSL